jgi:hypothetical protein
LEGALRGLIGREVMGLAVAQTGVGLGRGRRHRQGRMPGGVRGRVVVRMTGLRPYGRRSHGGACSQKKTTVQ